MNYRSAGIAEIKEVANKFPDYSLGKIILAIINRKPKDIKSLKEWLFNVQDEDLYSIIEETKFIESE